jgi:menaquinone-9 beta-reductase
VLINYPHALSQAYGGYYALGRVFVKAIGRPHLMRFATRHSMARPALMGFALKLLANLTDPRGDAADRLVNGLSKLAPNPK